MKFEKLKDYYILDKLAEGGFGSVYRGLHIGRQIDQKGDIPPMRVVIVKTVKEKYSQDPVFRNSFINEIKAAFPLNHPNIVQIYEYGESEGKLFYVLEYVEGRDVKQFINKLANVNFLFPLRNAIFTVIEAAKGLHYAHNFKDALLGTANPIVHRDMSPHNIMVSFNGDIKVIDFGIAKAKTNVEQTREGVIKGKLAYLAPEYINGEYDHRLDQFSLGIVLWELITRNKLFKGKSNADVIKKIDRCKVPAPSLINKTIEPELDKIILKALSKDPEQRYPTIIDFAGALQKYLFKTFPDFNPSDMKAFAHKLFKEEIKSDLDALRAMTNDAIKNFKKSEID